MTKLKNLERYQELRRHLLEDYDFGECQDCGKMLDLNQREYFENICGENFCPSCAREVHRDAEIMRQEYSRLILSVEQL